MNFMRHNDYTHIIFTIIEFSEASLSVNDGFVAFFYTAQWMQESSFSLHESYTTSV